MRSNVFKDDAERCFERFTKISFTRRCDGSVAVDFLFVPVVIPVSCTGIALVELWL